jgi:hypothetical protein
MIKEHNMRLQRLGISLVAVLLVSLACVAAASASLQIQSFDARVEKADGSLDTQAGSHPYKAVVDFQVAADNGDTALHENLKAVEVDLPAGFVGNPQSLPQCGRSRFLDIFDYTGPHGCGPETQVGIAETKEINFGSLNIVAHPIWNLRPTNGDVADFAFFVAGVPIHLIPRVRSDGDYGLTMRNSDISQAAQIVGAKITFWGKPQLPDFDAQRSCNGGEDDGSLGCSAGILPRALLSNPTVCGPRFDTKIRVQSWQDPTAVSEATSTTPTPATGCERVHFDPTVRVVPDTTQAGVPSGYRVDVELPQSDNPARLAQAHLRDAVVTMPEGVKISPASADGLDACDAIERCPEGSSVGTVQIDTPLLDQPLKGKVFAGRPLSKDAQSGDMFRIFVVAEAPGVVIRLKGRIVPDPATGRLTTTFTDSPQMPFRKMSLQFKGGPRAPLTNPGSCGTFTASAAFTPWSSATPVTVTDSVVIDRGCDNATAFAPSFSAGTVNPVAGASSSFVLHAARPAGQQDIAGLDVVLPAGLLGSIAGVPQCPEVHAAAGSCDAASQLGTTRVATGVGANPLWVSQPGKAPTAVYLAGPYKGAPFSLSIVVPAQAGPYDLGTVVVRAALFIDPLDAHVTVRADPLPTILSGIPLQLGQIVVTLDRPGFMRNPTSCAPSSIDGTLRSVAGAMAAVSARSQASDCVSLALKPSLALSLSGKGQTTDGKHPAITASLTQAAGQSNLKKVRVALPLSLALDTNNANGLCEFVDGSKVEPTCPKASIVGSATAVTPILDEPLSGPVYFVKNVRKDPKSGRDIRTLPKLVIPLVGQNGVKLTLTGTSDVEDDQLVTTFDNIPDAPVSSFKLNINGGKGGILVVSGDKADICKATQIAEQQVDGQNAKAADTDVFIQTPSCPLKVLSKKIGKTSVAIKIGGLGAGKVTVTGRGIKKTIKIISKSTVATITAKRTKGKPAKVTVSFDPAGPAKARKITK